MAMDGLNQSSFCNVWVDAGSQQLLHALLSTIPVIPALGNCSMRCSRQSPSFQRKLESMDAGSRPA